MLREPGSGFAVFFDNAGDVDRFLEVSEKLGTT
jgi:hypothetical protein